MVYIRFTTLLYLVRKRCTGGSCWGLVERFTLGLEGPKKVKSMESMNQTFFFAALHMLGKQKCWAPGIQRLDMPWHRRLPEGDARMAPERFSSKSFWPQKLDWRAGLCFLGPQESWGQHGVHRPREDGTICILLGICSQYACMEVDQSSQKTFHLSIYNSHQQIYRHSCGYTQYSTHLMCLPI